VVGVGAVADLLVAVHLLGDVGAGTATIATGGDDLANTSLLAAIALLGAQAPAGPRRDGTVNRADGAVADSIVRDGGASSTTEVGLREDTAAARALATTTRLGARAPGTPCTDLTVGGTAFRVTDPCFPMFRACSTTVSLRLGHEATSSALATSATQDRADAPIAPARHVAVDRARVASAGRLLR
jgi:hypothetical protein